MRAGLLLLLLVARVALASPGKFVIADVLVNGVTQQPAMIAVTTEGVIRARLADVLSWNLVAHSAPVEVLQGIDHIRLTGLSGISAQFDGATLSIDATQSALAGTRIDLRKVAGPSLDSGSGAYINYDLSTFVARGQRAATAAALEGIIYADTFSFSSNGIYTDSGLARKFVRYESSLRWDSPEDVRSLVVGDAVSRSGALARAVRFGGLSYGTNFATRPDLVTFALPAVPGESRIPTSAELLINGQTHSRFDLAPGPFEISNIPAINGAGEIQVVTRDPLGRQQVLAVPYYVTPALLRAGLTDAGFEVGRVREDFGLENFHYGRGFAKGTFRHGMTQAITMEAFAETAGGQHVAGAGVTALIGDFAVASAAIARGEGRASGSSASASIERSSRGFSFGLRGQYASRHFTQLGELTGLHYRFTANAGMSLGMLGNVNLIHVAESRYAHGRVATTAISYQKQIGKSLSLMANFSTTQSAEGSRHFAGVALVVPLDALASASLASTRQSGQGEHVLDVRQNLPADEGFATRARVTMREVRNPRVDAGVSWQNAFGQLSADASHASGSNNMRLGMNGSLVMAGGIVRPVRQLGDAFAIVSVPGFAGIDIFHENQRVARTDAAGFAVIPRLRPYEPNAVSLNTLKLSLATELSNSRRTVTPARRAGVLMQFKAVNTQGALVRVLKENGEPVPAGAMLGLRGESFPFATNGEAWVTGLDVETDATVEWAAQRCAVRIPVPDGSKARPRIGPLTCKGAGT